MKKRLNISQSIGLVVSVIVALFFHPTGAWADIRYTVGLVDFVETSKEIKIKIPSGDTFVIEVLTGGIWNPHVTVDDIGRIFFSNIMIDSATGGMTKRTLNPGVLPLNEVTYIAAVDISNTLEVRQGKKICKISAQQLGLDERIKPSEYLKYRNIMFAVSDSVVVSLHSVFNRGGDRLRYQLTTIAPQTCRIVSRKNLGNPGYLVELAWTKAGGWWITGAIEQTLLRSRDGSHWVAAHLPFDIHALIGSYISSTNEIWLAAGLSSTDWDTAYPLLYSANAGKTWIEVKKNDVLIDRLPKKWLTGIRQVAE